MRTVNIDGNEFKWAPLHAAAYLGRSRIMDILMSHGANVNLSDTLHLEV